MIHFLKVHVLVVHQQRITFPKFLIAGLCIPKVFLSWDTFKARRESPSAEPQLPLIPKCSFCHHAFHYCTKQMLRQMGE